MLTVFPPSISLPYHHLRNTWRTRIPSILHSSAHTNVANQVTNMPRRRRAAPVATEWLWDATEDDMAQCESKHEATGKQLDLKLPLALSNLSLVEGNDTVETFYRSSEYAFTQNAAAAH